MRDGNLSQEHSEEIPILEKTIEGFKEILGSTLCKRGEEPLPVVLESGDYAFRQQYIEKGTTSLPLIGLVINALDGSGGNLWYNNQALFNGVPVKPINGQIRQETDFNIIKLHAVVVDMTVMMMAQSLADIIDFSKRWIFRDRERQFNIELSNLIFTINVQMDKMLQVPTQTVEDIGNIYRMQTSCRIMTYTGEIVSKKTVTEIQASTGIFNPQTGSVYAGNQVRIPTIGIKTISGPNSYIPPGQNQ